MPSQSKSGEHSKKKKVKTINENKKDRAKASEKSNIDSFAIFYEKNLLFIWLAIIIVPILIISIGWLLFPEIFYDQFIWQYFWGTIEADAQDQSYGDVNEDYNPVNTIVYGFIVIGVLYWIYKIFKKLEITIDSKFFAAIVIFVFIGGITRTLEDAELFYNPMVYLFIAPIIYIFIGLIVITLLLMGAGIDRYIKKTDIKRGFILIIATFATLDIIYLITYYGLSDQFSYILHPIIPIIISILILIGFKIILDKNKRFDISIYLFSVGLWWLLINVIILTQWQSISAWTDAYLAVNPGKTINIRPIAFTLVASLTVGCVITVYIITRILSKKFTSLSPFYSGINLMLFFGHFLDASATYIAIDYYGYAEKHVLPTFFIEVFGTASVMLLLKAFIVIIVIYYLDVLYKDEFQKNPILTGLVKVAVLVLGLAPGTRDLLRLTIGV